jgi:hypothetical protein
MLQLEASKLIPLIELDPSLFRKADRSPPDIGSEDTAGWERYWLDSLADSGIVGLKPFLGYWLVAVSDLVHPQHLARLVEVWIDRCEAWAGDTSDDGTRAVNLDELGPLNGGYCLQAHGEGWVEPGCCSDLGNIEEWAKASVYRSEAWEMVWIGHPWVSVRYSEGLLVFSKPHESNFPDDWFAIEPGALNLAVDFARVKLEQFELTLLPIVERLVPRSEARDIVRILVRGL